MELLQWDKVTEALKLEHRIRLLQVMDNPPMLHLHQIMYLQQITYLKHITYLHQLRILITLLLPIHLLLLLKNQS